MGGPSMMRAAIPALFVISSIATVTSGCGGTEPVGGWTASCNGMPGLYACFTSEKLAGFGDRADEPAETISSQRLKWNDDGSITRSDGQKEGTWKLEGDTLTITYGDAPCSVYFCDTGAMTVGSEFCGVRYEKSEVPSCP
jgi:hypothetical protein